LLDLRASLQGLDQVATRLGATPEHVDRALRVTSGRIAGWLRRRAGRELSAALKVGLDVLRYRMKTLRQGGNGSRQAALWFGLNEVALTHLNPRELRRGVAAGPAYARGAFIAKRQVFRRKGKERLPIERPGYAIQEKADKALEGIIDGGEFQRRFLDTFEQELTKRWTR
jgi:hypothetical protein